jgi:cytochrome P450
MNQLRDAGGAVIRFSLGPKWLMPPIVVATSPEAIRDILSNKDAVVDKTTRVLREFRHIIGANLFDLPHEPWLPRRRTLQPVFTKQRVRQFGGHMAEAAASVAGAWRDGATVNLDAECRTLTLRALGRSVLGLDLTEHVAESPSRYGSRSGMSPIGLCGRPEPPPGCRHPLASAPAQQARHFTILPTTS